MGGPENATGAVAPIVERRRELGISQHELARLAGVHYQTVHRMEIGTQVPTWETRSEERRVGKECM